VFTVVFTVVALLPMWRADAPRWSEQDCAGRAAPD
jgi:uncharacterized protein YfaT (DUF1175 family)